MLFCALLRRIIENGELTLFDAHGLRHDFGTPNGNPPIIARLHDASLLWKLALNPRLMLGQAFMDRTLTVDNGGTIYDLLMLLGGNASRKPVGKVDACLTRVRLAWRRFGQANPLSRSRQNVAHHYDLSSNLYELFLDPRRQYSCAFFAYPEMSLEEAQVFKLNHIAAKLMLRPDHKVLDIGCGWGGLAIHLAETTGAHVTGLPCRRSNTPMPWPAQLSVDYPTACHSISAITVTNVAPMTASCLWACSSMWACPIMTRSSGAFGTDWQRMACR